MMNELEQLQQQIDILKANCATIQADIEDIGKSIAELKSSDHTKEPPHWIDYIFPPGSNLLRYKCSNCGYISTFKTLSCPRCKESVKG